MVHAFWADVPISAGIMTVDDTSNLIALTNRGKHRRLARCILEASCRGSAYVKLSPSSHNCSPPISAAHPQMGFDRGHLQQKVRISPSNMGSQSAGK